MENLETFKNHWGQTPFISVNGVCPNYFQDLGYKKREKNEL